jgi:hypothetical protein
MQFASASFVAHVRRVVDQIVDFAKANEGPPTDPTAQFTSSILPKWAEGVTRWA